MFQRLSVAQDVTATPLPIVSGLSYYCITLLESYGDLTGTIIDYLTNATIGASS